MSSKFMDAASASSDEESDHDTKLDSSKLKAISVDENDFLSVGEEEITKDVKKRSHKDAFAEEDDEEEEDYEEPSLEGKEPSSKIEEKSFKDLNQSSVFQKNLDSKNLSSEKLAKIEKKLKKTGIVYMSKIPPYMKPTKLRQILTKFGKIDRIFLKPENQSQYQKRVKQGGNKKRMYVEGWVEFLNKKQAKLCVETMNGQPIGGKKGNFYYDDILNLKYLKKFKWMDLTSQMARENEAKQSKLMMEISNATRLNKTFISNVEKAKMIENIQKRKLAKKQKEEEQEEEQKQV